MKYLPFILKHLRRNWIRTGSTVVAMALCVFLFCALRSVLAQVDRLIEGRSVRRLIVESSSRDVLPLSHAEQIRTVPGVKLVRPTSCSWSSALPKAGAPDEAPAMDHFFPNIAVDAEPYFAMRPELMVPPDQFRDFLGDLRGCVMGRKLAEKFGWKIGDHIFLESFVPGLRKASGPFEFVIRGLMDTDLEKYPATETSFMLFHFKYLSEGLGGLSVTLMYEVEAEDPARAVEVAGSKTPLRDSSADLHRTERAFWQSSFPSRATSPCPSTGSPGGYLPDPAGHAEHHEHGVRERRTGLAGSDPGLLQREGDGNGVPSRSPGSLGGAIGIGGSWPPLGHELRDRTRGSV